MKNQIEIVMSLLIFFHHEANEDAQEDVSKSTINKESNARVRTEFQDHFP